MSIRAIMWAFEATTGSPASKLVLIKLADNANDDGRCWPSLRYISQHTELSERTVQRHIQRLEEQGFLTVERRTQDGVNLPNIYHLRLANMASGCSAAPPSDRHQGTVRVSPGVASECHQGGVTLSPKPSLKPSEGKPSKESTPLYPPPSVGGDQEHLLMPITVEEVPKAARGRMPYPQAFEKFWQQYPRRAGKRAALKAWQAALKRGEDPDAIMAGVYRYAEERDGQDHTFTAHPATWLNRNGWEDAPGVNRPPQHVNGHEMSFVDYARRAVENADENHRRLTEGRRARKGIFGHVR